MCVCDVDKHVSAAAAALFYDTHHHTSASFHTHAYTLKLSHMSTFTLSHARTIIPKITLSHTWQNTTGADREVQRILLELLNQMDGFDQATNVKVRVVFQCVCVWMYCLCV